MWGWGGQNCQKKCEIVCEQSLRVFQISADTIFANFEPLPPWQSASLEIFRSAPLEKRFLKRKAFEPPSKENLEAITHITHTLVHFPVYLRSLKDHLYCSLWWGASVFTSRWKGKRIESWYDLLRIAGKWTKVCVTASYKKPQQFLIVHSHPKNPT